MPVGPPKVYEFINLFFIRFKVSFPLTWGRELMIRLLKMIGPKRVLKPRHTCKKFAR